jgi:hypothetical protein
VDRAFLVGQSGPGIHSVFAVLRLLAGKRQSCLTSQQQLNSAAVSTGSEEVDYDREKAWPAAEVTAASSTRA